VAAEGVLCSGEGVTFGDSGAAGGGKQQGQNESARRHSFAWLSPAYPLLYAICF
jgi:hypothetical protein